MVKSRRSTVANVNDAVNLATSTYKVYKDLKKTFGTPRKGDGSKMNDPEIRKRPRTVGITIDARSGVGEGRVIKTKEVKRKKKTLKDRVAELEATKSKYHYRTADEYNLNCAVNECAYESIPLFDKSRANAAIDSLPILNRPATSLVNFDATNANLNRSGVVLFKSIFSKLIVKNNYNLPVDCIIYCCTAKKFTSDNPSTALSDGDGIVGVTDVLTNFMLYPSDMPYGSMDWNFKVYGKARLRAGDEIVTKYLREDVEWDSAKMAVDTSSYEKGATFWCVRIVGCVSHEKDNVTTTPPVGYNDGQVDIVLLKKYDIEYESDVSVKTFETNMLLDTLTNAIQKGPNVIELDV